MHTAEWDAPTSTPMPPRNTLTAAPRHPGKLPQNEPSQPDVVMMVTKREEAEARRKGGTLAGASMVAQVGKGVGMGIFRGKGREEQEE